MRHIYTIILIGLTTLTSCDPDEETVYAENQEMVVDTTYSEYPYNKYNDLDYDHMGTLPNWGTSFGVNDLVGTKWVITRVFNGYAYTMYSDTLKFINGTEYTLNSLTPRTYTFSGITGSTNKSLTLNFLTTLGGSNYSGQVGLFFIQDGLINGAEFHDTQNQSLIYKIWVEKI